MINEHNSSNSTNSNSTKYDDSSSSGERPEGQHLEPQPAVPRPHGAHGEARRGAPRRDASSRRGPMRSGIPDLFHAVQSFELMGTGRGESGGGSSECEQRAFSHRMRDAAREPAVKPCQLIAT